MNIKYGSEHRNRLDSIHETLKCINVSPEKIRKIGRGNELEENRMFISMLMVQLESILLAEIDKASMDSCIAINKILECYYYIWSYPHNSDNGISLLKIFQTANFRSLETVYYTSMKSKDKIALFLHPERKLNGIFSLGLSELDKLSTKASQHPMILLVGHFVATLTDLVAGNNQNQKLGDFPKNHNYVSLTLCLISWIGSAISPSIARLWAPGVFSFFGKLIYKQYEKMHFSSCALLLDGFTQWTLSFLLAQENRSMDSQFIKDRDRIIQMFRALIQKSATHSHELVRCLAGESIIRCTQYMPNSHQDYGYFGSMICNLLLDSSKDAVVSPLYSLMELHRGQNDSFLDTYITEPFLDTLLIDAKTHQFTSMYDFTYMVNSILSASMWTTTGKAFFIERFSEIVDILNQYIHVTCPDTMIDNGQALLDLAHFCPINTDRLLRSCKISKIYEHGKDSIAIKRVVCLFAWCNNHIVPFIDHSDRYSAENAQYLPYLLDSLIMDLNLVCDPSSIAPLSISSRNFDITPLSLLLKDWFLLPFDKELNMNVIWPKVQDLCDQADDILKTIAESNSVSDKPTEYATNAILWMYRIYLLCRKSSQTSEILSGTLIKILPAILALTSCTLYRDIATGLLWSISKSLYKEHESTSGAFLNSFLLEYHTYILHDIQMRLCIETETERAALILERFIHFLLVSDTKSSSIKDNSNSSVYSLLGETFLDRILNVLELECQRFGNKRAVLHLFHILYLCTPRSSTNFHIDTHISSTKESMLTDNPLDTIILQYSQSPNDIICKDVSADDTLNDSANRPEYISWILRMIRSVAYFLADDSIYIQWIALKLLTSAFYSISISIKSSNAHKAASKNLPAFQDVLPLVNLVWPLCMPLLKQNLGPGSIIWDINRKSNYIPSDASLKISCACLDLLQKLSECCGDFLQSRFTPEIYPWLLHDIEQIITVKSESKYCPSDDKLHADNSLIATNLQETLLSSDIDRFSSDMLSATGYYILRTIYILFDQHSISMHTWPKRLWHMLAMQPFIPENASLIDLLDDIYTNLVKIILYKWPEEVLCDLICNYDCIQVRSGSQTYPAHTLKDTQKHHMSLLFFNRLLSVLDALEAQNVCIFRNLCITYTDS
jgi:hypothetical protein